MIIKSCLVGAASALLCGSMLVSPAQAAPGVTVSSSGLDVLNAFTYQDSPDAYITFTIRDSAGLASVISVCAETPTGNTYGCDSFPLAPSSWSNGDWQVRQVTGGWQVRMLVGSAALSEEECAASLRGKNTYTLELEVLGKREQRLASRVHKYALVCQGFAAATSGGELLTARVGRRASLPISVSVADSQHRLTSAQSCIYDIDNDQKLDCQSVTLASGAKKTTRGWTLTTIATWPAVNSSTCKSLRRNGPAREYQVVFSDASGTELATAEHAFTVTCR